MLTARQHIKTFIFSCQVQELCSSSLEQILLQGVFFDSSGVQPDVPTILWVLLDIAYGLQVCGIQP